MKIKINNEITQNISDIITTEGISLNDIISQVLLASHPVGSYYWSDDSTSPAKLFGGTWEQIKDKFIIAVGDNHTVGTSYGSNTKDLSHTHTSAAHTHTVAGHTHTSAAHTHSINGHTHTSAAHTHTVKGHTHTSAAHTHTTGNHTLTVAELPSHNHKSTTDLGCNGLILYWDNKQSGDNYYGAQYKSGSFKSSGAYALNNLYTSSTGSGTAHSHGNTGSTTPGATGSTSLTTNSTTPGATGSTSLTTNSTTPGATGSTSLTTNSTTPGATGSSLSSSFDITPACIAAYCWKRTA